jgi:hypothetical protein
MRTLMSIAAALLLSCANATAYDCAVVKSTSDLRAAPRENAKIITGLVAGDKLYINSISAKCKVEGNCDWTSIDGVWRLDGNNFSKDWRFHRGWVATRFLQFTKCDADMER